MQKYMVSILDINLNHLFNKRMHIEGGGLGLLIHTFLIRILEQVGQEQEIKDMRAFTCEVATYVESNQSARHFYVSKDIYNIFFDLKKDFPSKAKAFSDLYLNEGQNFLVAQLRHDVLSSI